MRTWRAAMTEALYGDAGFYRRTGAAAAHFRTSPLVSPAFAGALVAVLDRVDHALGRPARLDLADVGAGGGELLTAMWDGAGSLRGRLRPVAVEVSPRPAGLPPALEWARQIPPLTGMLVANEWLDVVPFDLVQRCPDGLRVVSVTAAGELVPGAAADPADAEWVRRWWPLVVGDRAEVGRQRDLAWAGAVARVRRGVAVAIDYGQRGPGGGGAGPRETLTGHRAGRAVAPVPDGTCDLTAHVLWDSLLAVTPGRLLSQREALLRLGVDARPPGPDSAVTDPAAYLGALAAAGEAAELLAPAGLGGFGWLVHSVGVPAPISSADPVCTGGTT